METLRGIIIKESALYMQTQKENQGKWKHLGKNMEIKLNPRHQSQLTTKIKKKVRTKTKRGKQGHE